MNRQGEPRVLIVLLGAIGDVIRGFPLVTHIKKELPQAHITWAVESVSLGLVKSHPAVNEIVEFKRKEGLKGLLSFFKDLKSRDFDYSLDLQRHLKSGLTTFFAGASTRIGFDYQNSRECNWIFQNKNIPPVDHFSDKLRHYLLFAEAMGLSPCEEVDFGVSPTREEVLGIEEKYQSVCMDQMIPPVDNGDRVLFFIGSTWPSREWPTDYFAKVAEDLSSRGKQAIIVGAPSDQKRATEIIETSKVPIVNMVGQTSLFEIGVLSTTVKAAVACDSGPMHIASAFGLPVVSVWGSTNPMRSTPYGNESRILQSKVGCRACYNKECPGLDTICLKQITPEVVGAMLSRSL